GQPAGSPLPGTTNLKFTETNLNRRSHFTGDDPILREQGQRGVRLGFRVEHLDLFDPISFLAVVNFTQIDDLPLKTLTLLRASILADTPIAMFLPILDSWMALKEKRALAHWAASLSGVQGMKRG